MSTMLVNRNKTQPLDKTCLIVLAGLLMSTFLSAQSEKGTPTARRVGVHRGNQVRTVFTNYGVIGQPGSQGPNTAWKYDNNGYATDIQPLVGVRLPIRDYIVNGFFDGRPDTLYSVIGTNASRSGEPDLDPGGSTFWGFEPLPNYFNPSLDEIGKGVAMSHLPETWPALWPDHPDWIDEQGHAEWNGFLGRDMQIADQESYFVMDDDRDARMFTQHGFLPDSTDQTRKGQGIQVSVRGLQWSHFLAQDVIFWIYEIKNIGTTVYDQTVFSTLVGTYVGVGPMGGDEYDDDASFFNIKESITYTWDFDHNIRPTANARWLPTPSDVGYIGYAFLESPGNPYDGIDNDGDNSEHMGEAPYFTENDFQPVTVNAGATLVLIDKTTFERTLFSMPATTTTVTSMGKQYRLVPDSTVLAEGNMSGRTLNANAFDGLDNDLDGIIDENYQLHYRQYKATVEGVVLVDKLNPVQYKDYVNGIGLNDLMIDERRNDGIDNDGDWDPIYHDVGVDGKPDTGDDGENDGRPTEGEPAFDSKDIDESDQIGLTSFDYFVPSTDIDLTNDHNLWQRMYPGRFDVPKSVVENRAIRGEDGDFIFGSGYFPLLPGETERFSLALVFGEDYEAVVRSKNIAQVIYDANYNFPRPPEPPTLTAVPGDGQVTLYWDKIAEQSYDLALKTNDFEGYKIYKSTDPEFSDIKTISNGYGVLVDYEPIAQFDLNNGIRGFFNSDPLLYELSSGKPFFLGENTGLQNTFVDNDVINGKTYYYAVTAYDRGDEAESIYPSENSKLIYLDVHGEPVLDKNTAVAVPGAPVSGFVPPESGVSLTRVSGASSATPWVEVVDQQRVKSTTYMLTFTDSLIQGVSIAYAFNLVDSTTGEVIFEESTNLLASNGDIFDGMQLSFDTFYQLLENIRLDTATSMWNRDDPRNLEYVMSQFDGAGVKGVRYPRDYMFVFNSDYDESSSRLTAIFGSNSPLTIKTTNFAVYDITDTDHPMKIQYGFVDKIGAKQDTLSHFDAVYLSNDDGTDLSWRVIFKGEEARVPAAGDTLYLIFNKPFSMKDTFVYRSREADYDQAVIGDQLKNIRVVPNPYIVSNVFEQPPPSQIRGRGQRIVNFINLPPNSLIRIYASNGNHVRTLKHSGDLFSGTVTWDLRSKEGLDIAFGIYFYVVEVEGLSKPKTGKLAIIK